MHAGAGAGLVLIQLSALIPGLLPCLAIGGLLVLVLALPMIALGVAATIVALPPFVLWRLIMRRRDRASARTIRHTR